MSNTPHIAMVVAIARNGAIGVDGDLPWRLPGDLAFFKRTTMGKPLVMGRKTWESLPRKPLPGRPNLVVTRDPSYGADGADVFTSVEAALGHAATLTQDEICIIGGAEIYRQAFERADRLYITDVDAEPEADTFFPTFDRANWTEVWREPGPTSPDAPTYSFALLARETA